VHLALIALRLPLLKTEMYLQQIAIIHTDADARVVGTLVNTNAITATPSVQLGHNVCVFASDYCIKQNATQIKDNTHLTDLAWSSGYVLSTFISGRICLYDLNLKRLSPTPSGHMAPVAFLLIQEQQPVTRCLFLPHEASAQQTNTITYCFLTATDGNAVVTLWSAFTADGTEPVKLQVFGLEKPSTSYLVSVCYGPAPDSGSPPSTFVVMADRTVGKLFAWHLRAAYAEEGGVVLKGCDYVVPLRCKFPTFSWQVRTEASTDLTEEDAVVQDALIFDIKLHSYHGAALQRLTVTSMMLLPPEYTWVDPTPAVRVERLWSDAISTHISDVVSDEGMQFDEEYDVDEDSYDDGDDFCAPDASALPAPESLGISSAASSSAAPFSNWLVAVAAKAPVVPVPILTAAPLTREVTPPVSNRKHQSGKKPGIESSPHVVAPVAILQRSAPVPAASLAKSASTSASPSAASIVANGLALPAEDWPIAVTSPPPAPVAAAPTANGHTMVEEFRKVIREELASSIIPAVKQVVQESIRDSFIQPILTAISDLANQGIQVDNAKIAASVSQSVDTPLRTAFASNMTTVLVPALETLMGQVFEQVSERLDQMDGSTKRNAEFEAMSGQMSSIMTELQDLRRELSVIHQEASSTAAAGPPTVPLEVELLISQKKRIAESCEAGDYKEAFTISFAEVNMALTLFCCTCADANDVFGGATPKLDQGYLLAIMQHLSQVLQSTSVDSELDTCLLWLKEIALSLNPPIVPIRAHLPAVLDELSRIINNRIMKGDQPHRHRDFNRVLQFVRGIQMV
jgi:hypothetical protein